MVVCAFTANPSSRNEAKPDGYCKLTRSSMEKSSCNEEYVHCDQCLKNFCCGCLEALADETDNVLASHPDLSLKLHSISSKADACIGADSEDVPELTGGRVIRHLELVANGITQTTMPKLFSLDS